MDVLDLPLLHRAVLTGDEQAVAALLKRGEDPAMPEKHGFSALELAKLLGKKECAQVLGYEPLRSFKVQLKGENALSSISLPIFEKAFNIIYRPFLTFSSYEHLCNTINACPYILRYPWPAVENHAYARNYFEEIWSGMTADVSVRWIDEVYGYGLFAETKIQIAGFIGVYAGVVRRLSRTSQASHAYCLHYPSRFWSINCRAVDAIYAGNLLRFMNHSATPNVIPLCAVDRGLLHTFFIAERPIEKGEQLLFNYGGDYWLRRCR